KNCDHLLDIRNYTSSLFHEQNHRLLWNFLPPPPSYREGILRYLNLTEALVIAMDMALGDELGSKLARVFYLSVAIYDPGTEFRFQKNVSKSQYRDYLKVAFYSTYLILQGEDPGVVLKTIEALFPKLDLAKNAISRANQLDASFIEVTNPNWQ